MLDDMLTSLQRLGVVGETIQVELDEQREYVLMALVGDGIADLIRFVWSGLVLALCLWCWWPCYRMLQDLHDDIDESNDRMAVAMRKLEKLLGTKSMGTLHLNLHLHPYPYPPLNRSRQALYHLLVDHNIVSVDGSYCLHLNII